MSCLKGTESPWGQRDGPEETHRSIWAIPYKFSMENKGSHCLTYLWLPVSAHILVIHKKYVKQKNNNNKEVFLNPIIPIGSETGRDSWGISQHFQVLHFFSKKHSSASESWIYYGAWQDLHPHTPEKKTTTNIFISLYISQWGRGKAGAMQFLIQVKVWQVSSLSFSRTQSKLLNPRLAGSFLFFLKAHIVYKSSLKEEAEVPEFLFCLSWKWKSNL